MDGAGMGRGGSKKCKSIPAPPRGAGLKSCPILAPSPLRGGENPHGVKRGGAGQAGRGKIAIPSCLEQLIVPRGLRSVNSNYEVRKTAHPHVWIRGSVSLISWKSKLHFFSSDEREKSEFWGVIVRFRAHNHALGLGFCPRTFEWSEEEQIVIRNSNLKSHK